MEHEKKHRIPKTVWKTVFRECAYTMRIPLFLEICTKLLTGILGIVTADTLGSFADSTFNLNFSLSVQNGAALAACLLLVVFAAPALGMLSDFIMLKNALRHDNIVFGHYLNKSIEKEAEMSDGQLQYELEDSPNSLRIQWVILMGKVFSLPVCLGYFLYCVGNIHWGFVWLILSLALLKLVIPFFFKEKLAEYDIHETAYLARRRDYETDILTCPHLIKSWQLQKGGLERINGLFQNYYRKIGIDHITCKVFSQQTQLLADQIITIIVLFAGALMVSRDAVTPGQFASLFVYLSVSQTFMNGLWEIIQNYPLMLNAARRVCEFYQDEESSSGILPKHISNIRGEKLGFRYSDNPVFEDLDFQVSAGDKVRICGANGRGKTTLMKILCTSLEKYEGKLLINGMDFQNFHKDGWRKIIAYGAQTPFLFSTTVRENIVMGNPGTSKEKADQLMKEFGILHLSDRTLTRDLQISGGEKQKISIVRTLLKDSEILFLDEPTNHLDKESIQVLKKYLQTTNKTVFLITHDESLTDVATKCIWIERSPEN